MKGKHQAFLLKNIAIAPQLYEMELLAPELAANARPGQFVMVSLGQNQATLLRRPFGIAGISAIDGRIRLIYQLAGNGTRQMSTWRTGRQVDLLGPLGNGFTWSQPAGKVVLAGGGLGIAPLLALAHALKAAGKEVTVFLGGRTRQQLFGMEEFSEIECEFHLATEDGSAGFHGFVTKPLEQALQAASYQQLYACGPTPFLKAAAGLSKAYHLPAQLSLEERMACGVGACMGCVVATRCGDGTIKNSRVCADGPVFTAEEVIFNG